MFLPLYEELRLLVPHSVHLYNIPILAEKDKKNDKEFPQNPILCIVLLYRWHRDVYHGKSGVECSVD